MGYALLAVTIIIAFTICIILLDRKNRRIILSSQPPHPFPSPLRQELMAQLGTEVCVLLDLWKLGEDDQKIILGLLPSESSTLESLRNGRAGELGIDLRGRIGHLLAIDQTLGQIFRDRPEKRYTWVTSANKHFSPIQTMRRGYEGILVVRRFLDFENS